MGTLILLLGPERKTTMPPYENFHFDILEASRRTTCILSYTLRMNGSHYVFTNPSGGGWQQCMLLRPGPMQNYAWSGYHHPRQAGF